MKIISKVVCLLGSAAVLCGLLTACDRKVVVSKSATDAFASAKPELKQAWTAAADCSAKNDYHGATTNLLVLRAQSAALSPEQAKALEEFWGAMGARIFAAAEKGNDGAVKAMQAISKSQPR